MRAISPCREVQQPRALRVKPVIRQQPRFLLQHAAAKHFTGVARWHGMPFAVSIDGMASRLKPTSQVGSTVAAAQQAVLGQCFADRNHSVSNCVFRPCVHPHFDFPYRMAGRRFKSTEKKSAGVACGARDTWLFQVKTRLNPQFSSLSGMGCDT